MGTNISSGAGTSRHRPSPVRIPPAGADTGTAPGQAAIPQGQNNLMQPPHMPGHYPAYPQNQSYLTPPSQAPGYYPAYPQHDPMIHALQVAGQHGERSLFNGFKRMSPQIQDAIKQTNQLFPSNIHGIRNPLNGEERAVAFHDLDMGSLVRGKISVGNEGNVEIPADLKNCTARVFVHSHPYTGQHHHYEPSLLDHIVARQHPDVDFIVQTPTLRGETQYFAFSGAVPPRYYRLLPNPENHPVPPASPDMITAPPFRSREEAGG